jgi:organic radical activating enzyme
MNNKGDETTPNLKSKFLGDAEWMKDNLGPALCLAKWKQVSLHLPTGLNNSCYHPPLHAIDPVEIQWDPGALHNTEHKKQQRQLMLRGERPTECQYCWNMENENKLSDRHYRSGEPWAAVDFEKIKNATGLESDVIPSYVEVNFNNACNLKCSYCSPQFSSSWADEANRHGAFPTATPHNAPEHFTGARRVIPAREHNPYVEAFWQWWPRLYPQLKHFRMTGGEPLLDRNTYRVFDFVLENPKPDLHLNVTSNFSVDEKSWQRYLDYVKRLCQQGNLEHFMQYVSLDGWGAQAEYMRNGLDFDLLWKRVHQFLAEVPSYNSLTFIVTMNNLSVTSLENLFAGILDLRKIHSHTYQRVWFDTPVLREPAWQSLQILPESYAQRLEYLWTWMVRQIETEDAPFQGFKDYELHRLDRDIAWMRAGQGRDHSQARADFYRFFSEHDRRRGTDFLKTFPEMRSWWAECESHARQA